MGYDLKPNDAEEYIPRAEEEHLYAACLLTLGGFKPYDHKKSHTEQVYEGMEYGQAVDSWWLAHGQYNPCTMAESKQTLAYEFRRRYLKWTCTPNILNT